VEHGIHQREALDVGDELHSVEGLLALKVLSLLGEREEIVGTRADVAVGGDKKASRADGGILHELARLRLDAVDHAIDQRSRREVLSRA